MEERCSVASASRDVRGISLQGFGAGATTAASAAPLFSSGSAVSGISSSSAVIGDMRFSSSAVSPESSVAVDRDAMRSGGDTSIAAMDF